MSSGKVFLMVFCFVSIIAWQFDERLKLIEQLEAEKTRHAEVEWEWFHAYERAADNRDWAMKDRLRLWRNLRDMEIYFNSLGLTRDAEHDKKINWPYVISP